MQNTRIIAKSLWRDGTLISRSTENPQFPAESTQDDDTTLAWRSRSGSGTGNGLFRTAVTLSGNLIAGADCESTAPFTPISGVTLDVWADGQAGNCIRMTGSTAENQYFYQDVNLEAGRWYLASAYVKSGTSGAVTAELKIGSSVASKTITTSEAWQQISFYFLSQSAQAVQIQCVQREATAGTIFFDTISIRPAVSNRLICFDEGNGLLVAALTAGDYNGQTLAAHVASVLSAVGGDYTCTYNDLTGKFTIARAAGNFTLYFSDGGGYGSTSDLLGFNAETKSGASTYTSDVRRIHTEEYLDIDLGAATEFDFIALLNHNLTPGTYEAPAALTLYAADDAAFTTGVTTDNITYNSGYIYCLLSAPRAKRYVRVWLTNRQNSNLYLSVGTIVVGKARDLGCPFMRGYGRGYLNDSIGDETPSRNLYLTTARPAVERWACSWMNLSDAARGYIAEAVRECGGVYALLLCTDHTDAMNNSYWLRMLEPPLPVNLAAGRWSWECEFEEHV